ncbi:E3 ubiquitin-protein ligase RSL1-like [Solanum dulcamara]|uniref:E3 ubiquitin-protein ligase RSL1-like n=1 Tax=Solanum dulcamara TaxID=45834 RepID=UPI002485BAFC|nr:E3 ubiquitin-protein ligase RSL1-like [Solanum dulcamara]
MEVLCTTAVKIIHISDDDDVIPKRKRKRAKIIDPVEEYSESVRSNRSGTKKVLIDISDDEIEILSKTSNSFMCEICVDEKPITENFQIMGCNHSYCNQCTINYIASKLQQNIPRISCPVSGCKGNYEPYYCRSILPKEVYDRWGDALCEMMIMDSEKSYCPYKNCSALLINERKALVNSKSKCLECKRLFCANCKVPWHKGIVCEEFQKLQKNNEAGTEDMLLMKLAKRRRWQRCPKCRIYVARTKGCPHMHCRCGCYFCYTCGAELSPNHKCTN